MKSKSKKARDTSGDGKRVKIEIYGEEMFEKMVTRSGNSGRVYLPPNWIGYRVKIIRMNIN